MEFLSLSLLVIFSSYSPLLSHKNSINKPPNFTSTQTHINPSLFSAFVEKSKANLTLEPTIIDLILGPLRYGLNLHFLSHGSGNESVVLGFGLIWVFQMGFLLGYSNHGYCSNFVYVQCYRPIDVGSFFFFFWLEKIV